MHTSSNRYSRSGQITVDQFITRPHIADDPRLLGAGGTVRSNHTYNIRSDQIRRSHLDDERVLVCKGVGCEGVGRCGRNVAPAKAALKKDQPMCVQCVCVRETESVRVRARVRARVCVCVCVE